MQRITIVMFGIYIATVGLHAAVTGQILYRNYVGGSAPAMVAVIIGITLIIAGLFMRN